MKIDLLNKGELTKVIVYSYIDIQIYTSVGRAYSPVDDLASPSPSPPSAVTPSGAEGKEGFLTANVKYEV